LRVVIWPARADFTTLRAQNPDLPPLRIVTQEANMVVDERSRHELYRRLEELLGPEAATTLIEHLPPVGWSDVATKRDLAGLEERIDLRFQLVDERFAGLDERIKSSASDLKASFEHELRSQTMALIFGMVSVVMTMSGLAFALVRFT
jgi:hypothetical protein